MSGRILIAGIGNILLGDDAFGVEGIRELSSRVWPDDVRVVDFGVRGYDLAFALTDGYEAAILVDAVARGEPPGTTYLVEIDGAELSKLDPDSLNTHSLSPVSVLQMAQSLGGVGGKLFLVGCEPATLETVDGQIGLSDAVRPAVTQAIELIESLAFDLLRSNRRQLPDSRRMKGINIYTA